MSTTTHPPTHDERDPSAQALLFWLGGTMLVVTALIVLAVTQLSAAAGVGVAFGGLIVAMIVVFSYIMQFIGPEDSPH